MQRKRIRIGIKNRYNLLTSFNKVEIILLHCISHTEANERQVIGWLCFFSILKSPNN